MPAVSWHLCSVGVWVGVDLTHFPQTGWSFRGQGWASNVGPSHSDGADDLWRYPESSSPFLLTHSMGHHINTRMNYGLHYHHLWS